MVCVFFLVTLFQTIHNKKKKKRYTKIFIESRYRLGKKSTMKFSLKRIVISSVRILFCIHFFNSVRLFASSLILFYESLFWPILHETPMDSFFFLDLTMSSSCFRCLCVHTGFNFEKFLGKIIKSTRITST